VLKRNTCLCKQCTEQSRVSEVDTQKTQHMFDFCYSVVLLFPKYKGCLKVATIITGTAKGGKKKKKEKEKIEEE